MKDEENGNTRRAFILHPSPFILHLALFAVAFLFSANRGPDFGEATSVRGLFFHRLDLDQKIKEARRANDAEQRARAFSLH